MQYSFIKFFSMQVYFSCFLIRVREREKKESGDSSVNGICGCGLPAHCCHLLLLAALFMQILEVSLTHIWPCRLFYSELSCARVSATSFPLSKHTGGGDTALTFSGLCVCLQLTWEVGLPPSPVEFSSLCHSHKLSHSWLLGTRPRSRQPACLFTVLGRIPFPHSSALSAPHPLSRVSLLFLLLITQFLFFPRVEVGLSRGLCCSGLVLSVGVPCTT
jgi:hypothetical protein